MINYSREKLNSRFQCNINTGVLRVEPFEVEDLLDVEIQQKINAHSTLYFKGALKEESKNPLREVPCEGANVILLAKDSTEMEHVLFQGIIRDVSVQTYGESQYLEVHAISYSYLMDIEKKSRSFQNKNNTYTDLIEQVTRAYPRADVIDAATDSKPTDKFIIQHQETDWGFTIRMASRFGTGLVCDVRYDSPKYFFGVPNGMTLELDEGNYRTSKDMDRYYQLSNKGETEFSENDFLYYKVTTHHMARIGDKVTYRGKQLYVYEITTLTDNDILVNHLTLTTKKGLTQQHRQHPHVMGASFGGNILEASNDVIKMSLDIDRGHDSGEPCFFPYSTVYSSQDGSGWYCMPEVGDRVRLYFPDGDDNHAYAISSVHEQVDPALMQPSENQGAVASSQGGGTRSSAGADGYSGMRDDPSVKSITYGSKEVRLTPEGVYIITEDSMITMNQDGITVTSENDVSFLTDKDIVMSSEDNVDITGTNGVKVTNGDSNAVMVEEDVQAIGQEVRAN